MKRIYFKINPFCFFLLYSVAAYTQNHKIDSLQKILQTQKEDTNKVNALNSLGRAFTAINENQKSLDYLKEALALSEKLNFKMGQGNTLYTLGQVYGRQHELLKAANYYEAAIKIRVEIDDKKGLAASYRSMGFVFMDMGNYSEALKMQFACLKTNEAIDDKKGIAASYNNIGILYWLQKDYIEALNIYPKALQIMKEAGDKENMNHPYNNMAGIYTDMGNYPEALKNYSLSLKIREEIGDKNLIADSYCSFGNVYQRMNKNTEALSKLSTALKLFTETENKDGQANVKHVIGEVNTSLKNFARARYFLNEAMAFYKEIGGLRELSSIYQDLAKLDSATANYKSSLENYKMYIFYRDSMVNQENTKKFVQTQMQYDFDKKEDSVKAAQDKKDILSIAEMQNQKTIRNFSLAGTFATLSFGVYSFYRFRKKKKIQSQQALMNERLRISRELHDEVGATLSGIAMYSHLTKEQIKHANTEEVEKSLNIMQQSAGEMVNKLNDIVWLINPNQDSLQKLIQRLEEYATDMAMIKNMQVKVNVPSHLAEYSLPVEDRRNIYLFCKEAINNAVKYSNGTLLELTIKETGGKLEFSVSDNGKGFDVVMVRRGNGLENMQKHADEIGAKLLLQSKLDEGCFVSMQIKIT